MPSEGLATRRRSALILAMISPHKPTQAYSTYEWQDVQ